MNFCIFHKYFFILDTPGYIITDDALIISNVSADHRGEYICRARVSQTGQMEEKRIRLQVDITQSVSDMYKELELDSTLSQS